MGIKRFLLLAALCWCSGAMVAPHQGLQWGGRIMGGSEISIEDTPWQVSIQNAGDGHFCGGAIYNDQIIITAAHCVAYGRVQDLRVRIGSTNKNKGGVLLKVANSIIHEKYDRMNAHPYDIAVVLLSASINLKDNVNVKAIELAKTTPLSGTEAFVSGWGLTGYGNTEVLRGVAVKIVDHAQCQKEYNSRRVTKSVLCAGLPGKSTCLTDSGGPLVSKGKLVGVVSGGPGPCPHNSSGGLYVNVAVLNDWIVKAARNVKNIH